MFDYLALKHTKSELTKAISKLITKIGNLGLKINMQTSQELKKSSNRNLLYQEMSTRSGSNLVLRVPINL
jgi:hypothetical protein